MDDEDVREVSHDHLLRMTADIVSAHVGHNKVAVNEVPDVIRHVFGALAGLRNETAEPEPDLRKPAVPVRRSVTPDFIICLEDGRKLKMLKRYLRTTYNMSPEEYRSRWNLPATYPMVAPNYAKRRSDFAKKIGLGRKSP